nr:putative ribonuclease H-like domain-containing protein [Tanacetum cinerariifolium]
TVKASAGCNWRNNRNTWNTVFKYNIGLKIRKSDDPHKALKDKGIVDSRCSRHMTGNKAHLADYQEFKGGSIAFGGSNGRITGKGTIKAGRLDFKDVYYVEELKHYNLFSVSQMCDKKNKASIDESNKWHRRLVSLENQANKSVGPQEANNSAGTQAFDDQGANLEEIDLHDEHFVLPIWFGYSTNVKNSEDKIQKTTDCKPSKKPVSPDEQIFQEELEKLKRQEKEANDAVRKKATHETQDVNTNITNLLNAVSAPVSAVGPSRALNDVESSYPNDPLMPHLQGIYVSPSAGIFTNSSFDDEEPKKISQALEDKSWVDAMQEELMQFQIQKVCVLVDLPFGKKSIGTKWVYKNKKDEREVVVRNKARLVAQGHRQEEGI